MCLLKPFFVCLSFLKNFKNWWQPACFIAVIIAGAGIIVLPLIGPAICKLTYCAGLILVLIYCYILIKLRFVWATIAGGLLSVSYAVTILTLSDMPENMFLINCFFLFSANLLGMFGGYFLEYHTRRVYSGQVKTDTFY